jgi:Leucine-rich repeat (LRR) protein
VPSAVETLMKLKYLNISHNKIRVLSQGLLGLKELQQVILHHNPIKGVPKQMLNQGIYDMEFLKVISFHSF